MVHPSQNPYKKRSAPMTQEEFIELENKPNDEAYFSISYSMSGKLGLKGAELMLYGLINGFSQDGTSFCYSSMKYIEELTGLTHKTVASAMESLSKKNLIVTEHVQFFNKQTDSGKIITVKARGSQVFALRYTVKSRPHVQNMINKLKEFSELIKTTVEKTNEFNTIRKIIKEIKENEIESKVKYFKPELADRFRKEIAGIKLDSTEDISNALLMIHYSSQNESLIKSLLNELSSVKITPEKKAVECKNYTPTSVEITPVECKNYTPTSIEITHNNKKDSNLKITTTSAEKEFNEHQESVVAVSDFTNTLIKLFGYNPCYPNETEQILVHLFAKYNISNEYLEKYTIQMFNQVKETCKNMDKLSSYLLKTFLNEGYISKFAYDIQRQKQTRLAEEQSMMVCPICGTRHNKNDTECPCCQFEKDFLADSYEISKAKAIRKLKVMDTKKYEEYSQAINEIYDKYPMAQLFLNKTLADEKESKIKEIENIYLGITA